MKFFYWTFISAILSSCAFHTGNISSGAVIDCPMKTIVTGQASTIKFFGLGGLNKNALILEAKKDLYKTHLSNKNIKLTNFSVDFKTSFILFYTSTIATVSADLYDCGAPTETYFEPEASPMINGLSAGDSIIYEYGRMYHGQINSISINNKCKISYKNSKGKEKSKTVDQQLIFKTSKHPDNKLYFGYKIGEEAHVDVVILKTNEKLVKPCTIIGLNHEKLLISYFKEDGQERILSIDKNQIRK